MHAQPHPLKFMHPVAIRVWGQIVSINLVKKEISRFLASTDPEVVCIRGKWGIGKTYTWNALLKEAKEAGKVGLNGYSYVSLFGLENLDQVRLSVFENSVSKNDIGVEPSIETIQSNTAAIAKKLGKKSVSIISSALKKYLPAADYVTRACPQLSQMAIEAR